ncbi:hypothetical protein PGTUg99_003996 [Puccinia graminis f. sp. tritici]|uniref:Uncharacterized protein n=1 Tax=Puccinia graminis f. sp. tritici TaxID=56615 RepID=A0A5B0RRD1_PUCGR|nr:hypothetical protein PGTUg99_003996 [Puccinia graminis f. sp. tritici]
MTGHNRPSSGGVLHQMTGQDRPSSGGVLHRMTGQYRPTKVECVLHQMTGYDHSSLQQQQSNSLALPSHFWKPNQKNTQNNQSTNKLGLAGISNPNK